MFRGVLEVMKVRPLLHDRRVVLKAFCAFSFRREFAGHGTTFSYHEYSPVPCVKRLISCFRGLQERERRTEPKALITMLHATTERDLRLSKRRCLNL
jgi:hypothetical protein